MIETRTSFNPFKMKMRRKEPVSLTIEVENTGQEPEIISMDLRLGSLFSFEKGGFKTEASEKIPGLQPSQKKKYYYDIWPKQMLRPGEHAMLLRVTEHYKGFNYVKRKYDKRLTLAVED